MIEHTEKAEIIGFGDDIDKDGRLKYVFGIRRI
jgi:hypothetical protein